MAAVHVAQQEPGAFHYSEVEPGRGWPDGGWRVAFGAADGDTFPVTLLDYRTMALVRGDGVTEARARAIARRYVARGAVPFRFRAHRGEG